MQRGVWVVYMAVALHLVWGVLFLVSGEALGSTPAAALLRLTGSPILAGVLCLAGAAIAIYGERRRDWWALLPQQALLVLSAVGSLEAVIGGHYADGVPRPVVFILSDQLPMILGALFHTLVLVDLGRTWTRPR